jgi:hypothetical protein
MFIRRVIDARSELLVSTSSLFGHASKSFFLLACDNQPQIDRQSKQI